MKNKKVTVGTSLISIGIVGGIAELGVISQNILLYILTGIFLAAYIYTKALGFLIPGCTLTAVSLFVVFNMERFGENISAIYLLLLMGMSFYAVFFIHTYRIKSNRWGERFWPLFPGSALLVISSVMLIVQVDTLELKYLNFVTPAVLLIIGTVMVVKGRKDSYKSK
ncbi:MAG: hypothetical protein N3B21_16660 [Clostridia bacterium]|nr:hypothetical protein [Clostridia bacterium]